MTVAEQSKFISELFTTVQDHIIEIDRDLATTYLSNTPFCVVLEDCSMGIGYQELQGINGIEENYALFARPASCLRFSRGWAEDVAALWNSDPKRPRVKVMGHIQFYQELRKVKVSILKAFKGHALQTK